MVNAGTDRREDRGGRFGPPSEPANSHSSARRRAAEGLSPRCWRELNLGRSRKTTPLVQCVRHGAAKRIRRADVGAVTKFEPSALLVHTFSHSQGAATPSSDRTPTAVGDYSTWEIPRQRFETASAVSSS